MGEPGATSERPARTAGHRRRSGLTARQREFVDQYLVDLNATQAAIRAGYSRQTARAIGSENLTKPDIRAAIDRALTERADRTRLTAKQVLDEVAIIAFSDIRDIGFGPDGKLVEHSPGASRAVAAYAWAHRAGQSGHRTRHAVRLWNKVSALRLLMQHLGLLEGPPTLEALLSHLPDEFANLVRRSVALAASRSARGGNGTGGPPATT